MTVPGSVWPDPVSVLRHEQVFGLQVPVDDAFLMGGGEAFGNLERVIHSQLLRNRTGVELAAQRLPFQKLHDGIGRPLVGAEVMDREDVRMRQRRNRLRFALEPRQSVCIRRERLRQDFDRDVAVELLVPRSVDLSHTARA